MSNEQAVARNTAMGRRDSAPYLWSDLLARRNALGIRRGEFVQVLRIGARSYRDRENGTRAVEPWLIDELDAMEKFVEDETDALLSGVAQTGTAVIHALEDQGEFERVYPLARTLRDDIAYPMVLQLVAAGRAAAIFRRREQAVEVHRGERRADLLVRRLAVGLARGEAAALLGVSGSHYDKCERGTDAPPAGLVSELQVIDDFIQLSGLMLHLSRVDGVTVVHMLDDQAEFERAFPRAQTVLGSRPYPINVHRIAAARRAQRLADLGSDTRIAVVSSEDAGAEGIRLFGPYR